MNDSFFDFLNYFILPVVVIFGLPFIIVELREINHRLRQCENLLVFIKAELSGTMETTSVGTKLYDLIRSIKDRIDDHS